VKCWVGLTFNTWVLSPTCSEIHLYIYYQGKKRPLCVITGVSACGHTLNNDKVAVDISEFDPGSVIWLPGSELETASSSSFEVE
jgi:hypothetical protein